MQVNHSLCMHLTHVYTAVHWDGRTQFNSFQAILDTLKYLPLISIRVAVINDIYINKLHFCENCYTYVYITRHSL